MDIKKEADNLLWGLTGLMSSLEKLEQEAAAKIEQIKADYTIRIEPLTKGISLAEKTLEQISKKHKAELFKSEDDRLDLAHGALIYSIEKRVRRARGMLERLEKMGRDDVIRIAKSVDWDALEKWTDAQLKEVGTGRVKKERFSYELFKQNN